MIKSLLFIFLTAISFNIASADEDLLWQAGQGSMIEMKADPNFVLTCWNIYKGGKSGMLLDLAVMLVESDFTLLQEFLLSPEQDEQINANANMKWSLAKSFKDGGLWTGVATVSRWEPLALVPLKSPATEPFANTPKMSLISKYSLTSGTELWLVNIHSLNFDTSHMAFKKQLDAVIDTIKAHTGPIVFAGDFNTWANARRDYLIKKTEALGMERADLENPIGLFSATLDHIFYRGVKSAKPSLMKNILTSDHNPLRLEFTL